LKKNLLVLFGGVSNEHEVSRVSAVNVIKNLSQEKYNIITVGINKLGHWIKFSGDINDISDGTWENNNLNKHVIFSVNRSLKGLIILEDNNFELEKIDVIFPVIHGQNGEDGKLQGVFETSGVPYVGCDSASSVNCMDKINTHVLLKASGIKKVKLCWFDFETYLEDSEKFILEIENEIGSYPYFVKPANSGSSVGISRVENKEELKNAIKIAAQEDKKIIIEENITGQEVECAVLGNKMPFASEIGEILVENKFYSYEEKYIKNQTEFYIPAKVNKNISEKIKNMAIKAYKIMGCEGLARIDFFVREKDSEVILNEINTMPGFTDISMYPKLMEKSGIACSELLDKLIDLALERKNKC